MSVRLFPAVLLACSLAAPTGYAIVNITDPTGNTSAPTGMGGQPADPGWSSLGRVNGNVGTGVYLGNGWVLTATHVFGTSRSNAFTSTTGTTYSWDGSTYYTIADSELTLYKLSDTPGLPAATLASSAPGIGEDVIMIGNGMNPESSPTTYYVDSLSDPTVWETTYFEGSYELEGYLASSGRADPLGDEQGHRFLL